MSEAYVKYLEQKPVLSAEEQRAKESSKLAEQCRYEFHVDMDFETAVEKLEEFDRIDPFLPGEMRKYGDTRVYFRVFRQLFARTRVGGSLSVFMEESDRFGADILILASSHHDGVNKDFVEQLKRHMGVEVEKVSLKEKAKRLFL